MIAFLFGTIGWCAIAIGVAGSLALLDRADLRKTTAFVIQVHSQKIVALQNSGWVIPETRR